MASRGSLGKHLAQTKSQVSGVNQSLITLPTQNPTPPQREKKTTKHTHKKWKSIKAVSTFCGPEKNMSQ